MEEVQLRKILNSILSLEEQRKVESCLTKEEKKDPERERIYRFVQACGLRRGALARLRVEDIEQYEDGSIWITINDPDDVPLYEVPVLRGQEHVVLAAIASRDPEELVFPHLPRSLSLQPLRIQFARALYHQVLADNELGYSEEEGVQYVLHALCLEERHMDLVRDYFLGLGSERTSKKNR